MELMLSRIMWRSPVQKCTQISQEMWKYGWKFIHNLNWIMIVTELMLATRLFFTEFHIKFLIGLVADSRSQTDGWIVVFTYGIPFLHVTKMCK
jgi:hypothetical protein